MAIKMCSNGHYYDSSLYSKCPHCIEADIFKDYDRDRNKKKNKNKDAVKNVDSDIHDAVTIASPGVSFSDDDSSTISLVDLVDSKPSDDSLTIGVFNQANGNDFVTGWLVCTSGPEKGRDYRIHHGFNKIGRSMEMDIAVVDDPAISYENHCSVVYDDMTNTFYLCKGKGTLTYINGKLLDEAYTLKVNDKIQTGDSEFEFIPFCGGDKKW